MIELEMQILSDRREGLLIELGRLVIANGFSLVRQRLAQDIQGAHLTMVVRGPTERQWLLEDAVGSHARVLGFEAATAEPDAALVTAAPLARELAPSIEPAEPFDGDVPPLPPEHADMRQIEQVLPQMALDYPRVFPWLVALEAAVPEEARQASLQLAGRRTGAWVYKRDYALGAKLSLAEALKRIALPALRDLATVEQQERQLHIRNSAMCSPKNQSGCRFFGGYLEGLLGDATDVSAVLVRHLQCRGHGADDCVLEIAA
ncbi:hypothetical protein [Dyella sp.]|uniref:hypothetical protein n=1 Tax=Dyella sp. TaxID=1869338 RepID=UPI002ED3E8BA